jgi:iron complex transport system substrate-binding protein
MKPFITASLLLLSLLLSGCRPPAASPPRDEIRIVSLAPSITESLCAIGAGHLLVGRTSACNYPPEIVQEVPVIGGFGQPSLELLANVRPTLVLDTALADESVAAQISAMGIDRRRFRCSVLDDIAPTLRELGHLTGHRAEAERLAQKIADTIAGIRFHDAQHVTRNTHTPSVYAEVWHDPLTTVGSNTFLADLIRLAGGQPIAASIRKDYFQIAPEQVIAENPDVILCLYMGNSRGAAEAVKRRPGWEHVSAVQADCVFEGLDNDVLLRPGPRLLAGLSAVRACVEKARRRESP